MGKHKRSTTDEDEKEAKKIKTEENATAAEEKTVKKEKKSKKEKKEKKNKKSEEQVEEKPEEKTEEKKEKKKDKKDKKEKKEKKHKKDKSEEETADKEEAPAVEEKKEEDEGLDDFVIKKPQIEGNFNIARPGMKPQRTGNNRGGGNKSFNKREPEGPVDETSTEVYVNGYPYETTEDQVRDLFKDCGTIKDITLPRFDDNPDRCRGFGFVEFSTAEEATKALELNGTPMGKRTISVQRKLSRAGKAPRNAEVSKPLGKCPDNCSTLFCGNLSFDVTDEAMKDFFKEFDIQAIRYGEDRETGQFKGFAFVEFPSSEETEKAGKLNGQKLLGRPIRLDYSLPKNRN